MNFKLNEAFIYMLLYVLVVFIASCCSYPAISYKEDRRNMETTPKRYEDRFLLKKEYMKENGSTNQKSHLSLVSGNKLKAGLKEPLNKVKAVNLGEKTMRPSDDDDDDDDDGGEYDGAKSGDECSKKEKNLKQDSVPMMIIRELDMVAMEIPMQDKDKEKNPKEWSAWSPCNKPCGDGIQSRWRLKSSCGPKASQGIQEREQQVKPCHLADCPPPENNHYGDAHYDYGPAEWHFKPHAYP